MSIKRDAVYTAVGDALSNIDNPCYAKKPPDNVAYPYAVFVITPSAETQIDTSDDVNLTLTINVWDNNPDSTNLETAVTQIDTALTNTHITTDKFSAWVQRGNIGDVPDPDEFVRRTRMTYLLKTRFK